MKKLVSICVAFLDNLNKPFKSSSEYVFFNATLCVFLAVLILLFNIIVNLDIWNFAWRSLLSNISAYKDVAIFSFVSLVYVFFFIKRKSNNTLLTAFAIKFVSTAYMINMLFTTFSMLLMDKNILDVNKWGDILPYRYEYPYSAILLLMFVWWSTWYASLKQREILKEQEPNYKDLFDAIRSWLIKRA